MKPIDQKVTTVWWMPAVVDSNAPTLAEINGAQPIEGMRQFVPAPLNIFVDRDIHGTIRRNGHPDYHFRTDRRTGRWEECDCDQR